MENASHTNQYEEPHFTCVIHYTKGCEKYISDFQKKVAMLRKHLEKLSPAYIGRFLENLEQSLYLDHKGQSK